MESFDDIVLPPHANPIVLDWLKSGKAIITPGPLDTPCWIWSLSRGLNGYGQVKINGMQKATHRVAVNEPYGLCACHSCDIPLCCNPSHIFIGTVHDNNIDMKRKGRRLKLGKYARCACGKAVTYRGSDCQDCRSIRLNKIPCYCGAISYAKGLCARHYEQQRKRIQKLK
jgi:hypothetical protein